MRIAKQLVAILLCSLAGTALAQSPCGECRAQALGKHKACNAAAKDDPGFKACSTSMSERMQACQAGACAQEVARMYEGYCAGCMQQAGGDAKKKKACEESVCRKAAG